MSNDDGKGGKGGDGGKGGEGGGDGGKGGEGKPGPGCTEGVANKGDASGDYLASRPW